MYLCAIFQPKPLAQLMKIATVIGIDIGGTSTKLALIDRDGKILARSAFNTHERQGGANFVDSICKATETLIHTHQNSHQVLGIGIGTPACDEKNGAISGAANLPFRETVPVRRLVEEQINLPVRLVKDANASALGEGQFGGAKGMQNFALLTLGTGLGSGLVVEGRVINGNHGLASEFGHTKVVKDGRQCGCGQKGCLETYVSATGLKRTVMELLAQRNDASALRSKSFDRLSAKDLTEAAEAGDSIAREAYRVTGEMLGYKIVDLIVMHDPEAIFLAGGLALAGDWLLQPTREAQKHYTLDMFKGRTEIYLSNLGSEDAALLGAASLIWNLPTL